MFSFGCDSLDLSFLITNTTANTLSFKVAGGGKVFVSGDSSDQFINATRGALAVVMERRPRSPQVPAARSSFNIGRQPLQILMEIRG